MIHIASHLHHQIIIFVNFINFTTYEKKYQIGSIFVLNEDYFESRAEFNLFIN